MGFSKGAAEAALAFAAEPQIPGAWLDSGAYSGLQGSAWDMERVGSGCSGFPCAVGVGSVVLFCWLKIFICLHKDFHGYILLAIAEEPTESGERRKRGGDKKGRMTKCRGRGTFARLDQLGDAGRATSWRSVHRPSQLSNFLAWRKS